jgi:hypothetical protein
MLSSTARTAWPLAGHPHLEESASRALREQHSSRRSRWSTAMRRSLGLHRPAHPLIIDSRGVWAWSAHESHAPATRHAGLREWIAAHPRSSLRLWVSGHLMRSAHATDDTMLGLLAQQARQHDVRVLSVAPWWLHAFQTATRCVGSLNDRERAAVCVVEGAHVAWVVIANGRLTEVRQHSLEAATVAALRQEVERMAAASGVPTSCVAVLGQGLVDGAVARGLPCAVLGRLDGDQPPQWLRPSLGADMD